MHRWIPRGGHTLLLMLAICLRCGVGSALAATPTCRDLTPSSSPTTSVLQRAITPEDLVHLRDIGMPGYSVADQTPFTVSPDHRHVAFTLRRADPASNDYCQGLYVVDIGGGGSATQIDAGGEFIPRVIEDLRGMVYPSGTPAVITPMWSPDGQWIAYLKRIGGITQVWRVKTDGAAATAVTHLSTDAEEVAWSDDGTRLIVSSRPKLSALRREIEQEGLSGFHQDWRVAPFAGPKPFPPASVPFDYFSVGVAAGDVRPATPAERARIDPAGDPLRPPHSLFFTREGGHRAWIAPHDAKLYQSPTELWATADSDHVVKCDAPECRDRLAGVWLSADGREVRYLRREGWANSQLGLYRWIPGEMPKAVLTTDDALTNCQNAGEALLCARESSLQPIRLVEIDPVNGASTLIFDPNPEFRSIRLGGVHRLHWRNRHGVETIGDLILPRAHRPGQIHPLIVVQYTTRGFLRGGTGDEYPIQCFAQRGFAVLSFERPPRLAEARAKPEDPRTWEQFEQENNRDWADRRNVLSSLLTGIELVIRMGVADPRRIGITGTSEGAMGTWFALNNTDHMFAAASMGSCCMDPRTLMAVGGETWDHELQFSGYPPYGKDDPRFWKPLSLAMNVDHVRIPMLIQVPDDEYAMALETIATYREHGRPVETYVFPGEHHAIWQPAHRLAMYRRNLDWFDRWLGMGAAGPSAHGGPASVSSRTEAMPRSRRSRESGHRRRLGLARCRRDIGSPRQCRSSLHERAGPH
jgi:hypothetical protein